MATIQFESRALLMIKSNSKIKINNFNKQTIELEQKKGSTFSNIFKKGSRYRIKTPVSTAAVRGTQFSIIIKKGKTSIKLLKGKLKAIPIVNGFNKAPANPSPAATKHIFTPTFES